MKNFMLAILLFMVFQLAAQEKKPLYLSGQFNVGITETGLSGQNSNFPNQKNTSLNFAFIPSLLWEKPSGTARGVRLIFEYGNSNRVSGTDETTGNGYTVGLGIFNRIVLTRSTATLDKSGSRGLKFWLSPGIDLMYTKLVQDATITSEKRTNKGYLTDAQLQAGISYFLNDKFRLTAAWQGLSYTYSIGKRVGMEGITYGHNFEMQLNPAAIRFGVEMRIK